MAEPLVTLSRKEYPGAHSNLEDLFRPLGLKTRIAVECDSGSSVVAAIEAGRGISLTIPVLKLVTGKRLLYRPLTGVNETISIGIARARTEMSPPPAKSFATYCARCRRGAAPDLNHPLPDHEPDFHQIPADRDFLVQQEPNRFV